MSVVGTPDARDSNKNHVAGGIKGKVTATVGHLDELVDDGGTLRQILWVDEVGWKALWCQSLFKVAAMMESQHTSTKLLGPFRLFRVGVNRDDLGAVFGLASLKN